MTLQALRRIGVVKTLDDAARMSQDVQANFNTLGIQSPRLIPVVPATGHISFLVMDDTGTWQQYELVAGAGVTLTIDSTHKTVTISSP